MTTDRFSKVNVSRRLTSRADYLRNGIGVKASDGTAVISEPLRKRTRVIDGRLVVPISLRELDELLCKALDMGRADGLDEAATEVEEWGNY